MALYFADTEITGIKNLIPLSSKDITNVYFADTELFTVWDTYDGTFPAQYSANGSTLVDYRVYGSAGKVGDRTVNLFDKNAKKLNNGYTPKTFLRSNGAGTTGSTYNWYVTEYINISGCAELYCDVVIEYVQTPSICFYDSEKNYISGEAYNNRGSFSITVPQNAVYCRASVNGSPDEDSFMITDGSTAPSEYVPYGYAVPMSVSDGTTSTITPIYIGSDPLGEDEYVDYGEEKVYRRTENFYHGTKRQGYYDTRTGQYAPGLARYVSTSKEKINQGEYTFSFTCPKQGLTSSGKPEGLVYYWSDESYIGYEQATMKEKMQIVPPTGAMYYAVTIGGGANKTLELQDVSDVMLTEGSTAPSTYIPYLQPTDPPVPLPALPTVDGTNVVDYAGQSAAVPSRFVAKYRKEGFN